MNIYLCVLCDPEGAPNCIDCRPVVSDLLILKLLQPFSMVVLDTFPTTLSLPHALAEKQ